MRLSTAQTDLSGRLTRRVCDLTPRKGFAAASVASPWDITFDGATASFAGTHYMRGPLTLAPSVADHTVSGDDGNIYLGVEINTAEGTAAIIEGATLAEITDQEVNEEEPLYKIPLYIISKATVNGSVSCSVTFRYVWGIPNLVAYV
jgi:hypothetical protein